jgi:hypothetical protein
LLDLSFDRQWLTVTEWAVKYGDVVDLPWKVFIDISVGDINYVNVAGQDLIYLNSFDVAIDLLEKRSSLYSDRSHSSMMKLFVYQLKSSNII